MKEILAGLKAKCEQMLLEGKEIVLEYVVISKQGWMFFNQSVSEEGLSLHLPQIVIKPGEQFIGELISHVKATTMSEIESVPGGIWWSWPEKERIWCTYVLRVSSLKGNVLKNPNTVIVPHSGYILKEGVSRLIPWNDRYRIESTLIASGLIPKQVEKGAKALVKLAQDHKEEKKQQDAGFLMQFSKGKEIPPVSVEIREAPVEGGSKKKYVVKRRVSKAKQNIDYSGAGAAESGPKPDKVEAYKKLLMDVIDSVSKINKKVKELISCCPGNEKFIELEKLVYKAFEDINERYITLLLEGIGDALLKEHSVFITRLLESMASIEKAINVEMAIHRETALDILTQQDFGELPNPMLDAQILEDMSVDLGVYSLTPSLMLDTQDLEGMSADLGEHSFEGDPTKILEFSNLENKIQALRKAIDQFKHHDRDKTIGMSELAVAARRRRQSRSALKHNEHIAPEKNKYVFSKVAKESHAEMMRQAWQDNVENTLVKIILLDGHEIIMQKNMDHKHANRLICKYRAGDNAIANVVADEVLSYDLKIKAIDDIKFKSDIELVKGKKTRVYVVLVQVTYSALRKDLYKTNYRQLVETAAMDGIWDFDMECIHQYFAYKPAPEPEFVEIELDAEESMDESDRQEVIVLDSEGEEDNQDMMDTVVVVDDAGSAVGSKRRYEAEKKEGVVHPSQAKKIREDMDSDDEVIDLSSFKKKSMSSASGSDVSAVSVFTSVDQGDRSGGSSSESSMSVDQEDKLSGIEVDDIWGFSFISANEEDKEKLLNDDGVLKSVA